MTLLPRANELMARARHDLRLGLPVVIGGGNFDIIVLAVEAASDERIDALLELTGPPLLALTERRARTLNARVYDQNVARLVVPGHQRHDWIRAVADPSRDLKFPMKGPFTVERGGNPEPYKMAVSMARQARLLPAVLAQRVVSDDKFSFANALARIDCVEPAIDHFGPATANLVASSRLPIVGIGSTLVHVFRLAGGSEEHCAVEFGRPERGKPALARLHSACFTGDVLGSLKCDCGPQLRLAVRKIGEAGNGLLLYLNQEGRGIGLANKIRAYSLQDQGFDTVEANHRLGFEDDERDFQAAAEILKFLGFSSVDLMTNNPSKVDKLAAKGIRVNKRIPLKAERTPQNSEYLSTKVRKSGHLL